MLAYARDGQTTDIKSLEQEEDDDEEEATNGANASLCFDEESLERERCDGRALDGCVGAFNGVKIDRKFAKAEEAIDAKIELTDETSDPSYLSVSTAG